MDRPIDFADPIAYARLQQAANSLAALFYSRRLRT